MTATDPIAIRLQINEMRSQAHKLYYTAAKLEAELSQVALAPTDHQVMGEVAFEVCLTLNIPTILLFSPNREQHVTHARGICAYIVRDKYDWSFPRIGRALGRDHSSIINVINLVKKRMEKFPAFCTTVNHIRARIDARLALAREEKNGTGQNHDVEGNGGLPAGTSIHVVPDV